MLDKNDLEKIKKTAEEFFQKMTFEAEVEVSTSEEMVSIKIKTEEPQILIGQNGQTLLEIQHLLKIILTKKVAKAFYLDVDVSDYKKKKIEYLKELARTTADQVVLTKKEKTLDPMPAYERRIIHLELSGRTDVVTQSAGEEPERKIIISPRP